MATHGFGVKLQSGDQNTGSGSTTWTNITPVLDITPPTAEADDIEVTNHSSTGKWKEFISGLADAGQVELTCLYTRAGYLALNSLFRTQKGFRIAFPLEGSDTQYSGFVFTGYIKSIGPESPLDDVMTHKVVIKITGDSAYDDQFSLS